MLTVVARAGMKPTRWLVKCDCGVEKVALAGHLFRSVAPIKSCGCLKLSVRDLTVLDRPAPHGAAWLPLGGGGAALLDKADHRAALKFNWCEDAGGYAFGTVNGERVRLHEWVMGKRDGYFTDHKSTDRLDCRRSNLRWATYSESSRNMRIRKNKKHSIYKGVDCNKAGWRARIRISEQDQRHLGYFESEVEAARAYDHAARKHFGKFARFNFPKSGEQFARKVGAK